MENRQLVLTIIFAGVILGLLCILIFYFFVWL